MDTDKSDPARIKPLRMFILVSVLVVLVVACGLIAIAPNHVIPQTADSAAAGIDRQVAQLVPHPPEEPTIFARAMSVRNEIKQGRFEAATREIRAVLKESRVGPWSFQPFSAFIDDVAAPSDEHFADRLAAY